MVEFKSYKSYLRFAHFVATQRRFARRAEQNDFLQAVLLTSETRQEFIEAGTVLWRAQLHTGAEPLIRDDGSPEPFDDARMKPLERRAREGRANPKGIPYLYTADDMDTAVAEIRPWTASHVSLASFVVQQKICVVNCVSDRKLMAYGGEPSAEERERSVWRHIDQGFSQPVTATDDVADYAPTQILAEFFREKGFDGVKYGSSLGRGHSIALFNVADAKFEDCRLVKVANVEVNYTFVEYCGPFEDDPGDDDPEESSDAPLEKSKD